MLKYIFSMKVAVVLLFLFGAIIGTATFIENDYGTQTAKALVYSSKWFEVFLLYFIVILIYNVLKYKSYKRSKMSVAIFHMAFLIIAIGAAITRYVGYEGIMKIREGQSSSKMVSDVKVLQLGVASGKEENHYEQNFLLSSMTKNNFVKRLDVDGKEVLFELVNYLPAAQKILEANPNGKRVLELMISNGTGNEVVRLKEGDTYDAGTFILAFNHPTDGNITKPIFNIFSKGDILEVHNDFTIKTLSMQTRQEGNLTKGINRFEQRKLYQFNGNAIVLKKQYAKSIVKYASPSLKTVAGKPELATFKVTVGKESQMVDLLAYRGNEGKVHRLQLGGVDIRLSMGAKVIALPFSLKLIDFQLERYPGSNSPSSYASEVELTDESQGITSMPYRIYMNHILDHRNYRFFQSSYDRDEKGTVLSVNHDPGTLPTYIGYLLLAIGMIWNLFSKNGRLQKLLRGARKLQGAPLLFVTALALSYTTPIQATGLPKLDENSSRAIHIYDSDSVEKFGKLVIQDHGGRMKPIDTLAHEIIAKLSGKSSIYGVEPSAMLLGMTVQPRFYQNLAMIKVDHTRIAKELGLAKGEKYAKFSDFFSTDGAYKLSKQVSESVRKKPLDKNLYDKELIKVDERLNVAYMTYSGSLLQLYPKPHDANNKWMNPQEAIQNFPQEISKMVRMMTIYLFEGAEAIQKDGNTTTFDQGIHLIDLYQKKFGSEVLLSKSAIDIEVEYNKLGLFSKLVPLYLLVGIFLLLASFINVVKPNFPLKRVTQISWVLMVIGFIIHIVTMGIRWYIGGHAPWSNAYESIIFIAASTMVAGLIFARKSPFTLGATALLAGVTMGVAHLNFINPEITNLVPVLKSYWLMIHVATIISGDGFLGLGSMLSLLVLILFIIKGSNNENIERAIKELTNIAEMSLIVGLFLLTIGNFLGGVWANESWGRYWGWDAKETWAAVTILVYAMVLHLRFIPKFNNPFSFNVASLWAYSSVIMTYFGVNYYLSGMHSYAAGAPVPIPTWVPYAISGLLVLTLFAAKSWKNIKTVIWLLAPYVAFGLVIRLGVMQ